MLPYFQLTRPQFHGRLYEFWKQEEKFDLKVKYCRKTLKNAREALLHIIHNLEALALFIVLTLL